MPQPQLNINISGLEEAEQAASNFSGALREAVELPASAFNYNTEAMIATFGEAAGVIQNWAQAVSQFGERAGQKLNESLKVGNVKGFREQLRQLQVPEINEENIEKLQRQLEKAKEKMSSLKVEMKNKLTMGKITESIDDKGYRNLREQIALTGKTIDALQGKIKSLSVTTRTPKINADIGGLEETIQNLDNLSGQLQNMKNLFIQTFADLKSGDIFRYLSESAQNFVKKAQLAAGTKVYTEDYKTLQGDIQRSEKALDKLKEKQRDMEAAGTSQESTEWQKVVAQIATAQARLDSYNSKKREMESSDADVQFTGGLANQSALKNMGVVAGEALSSLRQKLGEIPGAVSQAVGNIPIIGRVAKEAAFLGQSAFNGFKFALSSIPKVASAAASAISKVASMVAKLVSGVKGAISKISKMAKSFIGLKGAGKGMNTSLKGGLKMILRYGLGIRSFYALINKLRTAMKEAFKNLAQYSTETNASISMLKSSSGALKNSLAVAFAPILNVIAPALSAFIDMLTKAFNAVGRFFAALTGKSFAVQAKKNFTDYAAGAEKANKSAEKLYSTTLGIDELNINSGDKDGGAGSGSQEISPEDMFETVPIDSSVSDFAQKVKDAWANADFTEVGTTLGTKLKNAFGSIDWEPIKESAAKIGTSIGTLINGFVETDGLAYSIGQTIGETINTGITGINAFLDSTHWDSVGAFIGEGLNGIVDTVDWEGLGHLFAAKFNAIFEVLGNLATTFKWSDFGLKLATSVNTFITDFDWAENGAHFGELIKGLLDTIISFLEKTDWQALGNGIADFIGGIDWGGILERLAEGIGAALGGLAALLWGLIEDAWNSVVVWWQETAFEDGQFTITGLLDGIQEALNNIGVWIYEHIFTPFIDGLGLAFGIGGDSPSTVLEEKGIAIMQGLFDGISSLVDKVVGVFTKIKDKIIEIWNTLKTKTTEIWGGIKNAVKTPINGIIGFVNGMVGGVVDGLNGMINAVNQLHFDLPDWLPLVGGKSLGFTIPTISAPQIPYLAKGAVLKGGDPFLAVLNDQKRGQTNIEAPLKVIQEALREELAKFSLNVKTIVPNKEMFNYALQPALNPSFDPPYKNYGYAFAASYTPSGGVLDYARNYERGDAETNSLLREQNELLRALLDKEMVAVMDTREALADLRAEARREGYTFRR